ncbi:MAG: hypothetical protein COA70_01160 [Planctomycetota bacterium]|nr:MAG: hypothetical protein COA70_01160 [Planctomycetota bacterium]
MHWTERMRYSVGFSTATSNKIYSGTSEVANPTGEETEFQQWALNLHFQQDAQRRWSLTIPTIQIEARNNTGVLEKVSGLGDFALVHGWRPQPNGPWEILVGLELPTGEELDTPAPGVIPPSLLQPGSGTWDPLVGVSWTKVTGDFSHTLNGVGLFPLGSSDADLDPGNLAQAMYRVGWNVNSSAEVSLGFEGIFRTKDKLLGTTLANTSSMVYALRPGFRWAFEDVTLFVGARFPLAYDVDATQIAPGNLFEFWLGYGG